ncbi:MAG: hypothetical protein Q9201_007316 [Fulgogasparrea decipioides]
MSSPASKDGAQFIPTTQQACEAGNKSLEERLRCMLLSHVAQPQQLEPEPSASDADRQVHPTSHYPPLIHDASRPNQQQPTVIETGSNLARGGANHRGRSGPVPRSRQRPLEGEDSTMAASDLAGGPLPFTIKPARNNRRRPASDANRSDTSSSSPMVIPTAQSLSYLYQGTPSTSLHPLSHLNEPSSGATHRQTRVPSQLHPSHNVSQIATQSFSTQNFQQNNLRGGPQSSFRGRPPQQHRQLYNPHTSSTQLDYHSGPQGLRQNRNAVFQSTAQAQIRYLDAIAQEEVPKAAISTKEEQHRERIRQTLEDICQRAITEYEIMKDALFDGSTVSLKCFGSLRSGFATHSSDMDLALESPTSKPDTASAESEIPRLLEKALLDLGYGARLLTRTRVPIIRFCEDPTPELAGLLKEERLRWEEEKDAPLKTKQAKKPRGGTGSKESNRAAADGKEIAIVNQKQAGESSSGDVDVRNAKEKRPCINAKLGSFAAGTDGGAVESVTASLSDGTDLHTTALQHSTGEVNEEAYCDSAAVHGTGLSLQQLLGYGGESPSEQLASQAAGTTHTGSQKAGNATTTSPIQTKTSVAAVVAKERREKVLPDDEIIRLYRLAMKEGWFEPHERDIIFAFIKAVESGCGEGRLIEHRSQLLALPDILNRYRPPPEHHLDFPKDGVGVQCDINFSNRLALHNSTMLRCYNMCDYRVKPMVLFIKAWAKRRKINSPYHGTLSSYGYVLMVLHYLVNVTRPPICPNLQAVDMAARDESFENTQVIDGHNVRFWRNEKAIQQWAKSGCITEDRHSTVGSLLRGFFQYFAVGSGGFNWGTEVLSLRTPGGILTKQQKGWFAAKTVVLDPVQEGQKGQEIRHRYLFAIEDPFETDHNIARTVVHNGIVAIRDEFRRANRLVHQAGNGKPTEDLFEEAASKDDLNYRYFGPRPKPPEKKVLKDSLDAKSRSGEKKDPNKRSDGIVSAG